MDKQPTEIFSSLMRKELHRIGKTTVEITEWQTKLEALPLPEVLAELALLPEFNKERIEAWVRVSGAEVRSEIDTSSKEIDSDIYEALAPILDTNSRLIYLPVKNRYSYFQLQRILRVMLTDFMNVDAKSPDELKLSFIVTNHTQIKGRVLTQVEASMRSIPLVTAYTSKKYGFVYTFFGEPRVSGHAVGTIFSVPFWVYKIKTEDNEEIYSLSQEPLPLDDIIVEGMFVPTYDAVKLSTFAKLASQTKIFFIHNFKPNVVLLTEPEFWKTTADWTLASTYERFYGKYPQPDWFMRFMTGWNFSSKLDNMPTHLSLLSPPSYGKSKILNCLSAVFGDNVVDGGTIKGLVPSFAQGHPEEGGLVRRKYVGLVDEFLHTIATSSDKMSKGDFDGGSHALLKVLEHSEGEYSSAFGTIKVKPRMWVCFCSNIRPYEHIKNLVDLHAKLNPAFMSRLLWYVFDKEHLDFILANREWVSQQEQSFMMPKSDKDTLAVTTYLRQNKAEIPKGTAGIILEKWRPYVPVDLLVDIYDSRMVMHIQRILDGYAKLMSIAERRGKLVATAKDIEDIDAIFGRLVKSWSFNIDKEKLPPAMKLAYLPDYKRDVYEYVKANEGVSQWELAKAKTNVGVTVARELETEKILRTVYNTILNCDEFYTA